MYKEILDIDFEPIGIQSGFISVVFAVFFGLFFSLEYISILVLKTYDVKRCIFFPHSYQHLFYHRDDIITFDEDQESKNVYQIEDRLFKLLGKEKPREIPIDYIVDSAIFFLLVLFMIICYFYIDFNFLLRKVELARELISWNEHYLILRIVFYLLYHLIVILSIVGVIILAIEPLKEGLKRRS